MKYAPKKVFIKENNEYVEISYQECEIYSRLKIYFWLYNPRFSAVFRPFGLMLHVESVVCLTVEIQVSDWFYMDTNFYYVIGVKYEEVQYLNSEDGLQNMVLIITQKNKRKRY